MEGTRVFVSGLPPTFSSQDLGKHFGSRFKVTDAHVIPKRGIGFVGFKDAAIAKQAVDYFNKTYIRMSKISVEIARPAQENNEKSTATGKHGKQSRSSDSNDLKRKRDDTQDDPKFQEYLSVMQRPSKTKTWANDEDVTGSFVPTLTSQTSGDADKPSEEELPQIPRKKQKTGEVNGTSGPAEVHAARGSSQTEVRERVPSNTLPNSDGVKTQDTHQEAGAQEPSVETLSRDLPQSDADWLRSKTSRLLGLEDEEQVEHDAQKVPDAVGQDRKENPVSGQEVAPETSGTQDSDETGEKDVDADVALIRSSARLFIRNLPYDATEADLEPVFSRFGKIEEIHVAFDTRSSTSKGFAYVQYVDPSSAIDAYKTLDGKDFQGRLLHVLPATAKKTHKIDEYELSKLPLKKQKQIRRKMEASSSTFNWNSLYMNADAVMSSVAERLGVSKADLLDPTSSDAAVKQAHAETHVIQETKAYFAANGVNLDSFKQRERGNTAILVKNFSYGVTTSDLRKLFEQYGQLTRLLMPPSGTIAIVEFARPDEAQKAFRSLAYRKLGDSILFLERAPKDLFDTSSTASAASAAPPAPPAAVETKPKSQGFSTTDTFALEDTENGLLTSTLFVRNLNFATTSERLAEVFKPLDGFLSATVKTKPDPKRPGQTLSMGFGFVEFRTKAQAEAALAAMNGYNLDNHELVVKLSHKGMDAAEERRREDTAKKVAAKRTKIIIKNLPFQATKKDVRALFGAYGQLRSVRVPKKFDRTSRGFAFADFVSAREAENAMDALKNTHLLGRKLVLEYASADAVDPEEEIQNIEKKMGQQVDRVKLQGLLRTDRKKFVVGAQENEED
ncbi:hypothetical protein VTN96DRAFT_1528 [Rasamsonia emersonii]